MTTMFEKYAEELTAEQIETELLACDIRLAELDKESLAIPVHPLSVQETRIPRMLGHFVDEFGRTVRIPTIANPSTAVVYRPARGFAQQFDKLTRERSRIENRMNEYRKAQAA